MLFYAKIIELSAPAFLPEQIVREKAIKNPIF
jgi:hypothetical protein